MATTGPMATVFHRPIIVSSISHDSVSSSNWSGYAAESSTPFTDVVSSWVQPTASCNGKGRQFSSFWVGLDGYSSNSVEQLGTDSDCVGRTPAYYGWYEMYPAPSVNLSSAYPVHAGDTLTARVTRSGTSYTLSLREQPGLDVLDPSDGFQFECLRRVDSRSPDDLRRSLSAGQTGELRHRELQRRRCSHRRGRSGDLRLHRQRRTARHHDDDEQGCHPCAAEHVDRVRNQLFRELVPSLIGVAQSFVGTMTPPS